MFTAIIAVCILFLLELFSPGSIVALRQSKHLLYWFKWAKSGDERWRNRDADLHEIIPINMNTLKLEVSRSTLIA